jgi:hypothetical protein
MDRQPVRDARRNLETQAGTIGALELLAGVERTAGAHCPSHQFWIGVDRSLGSRIDPGAVIEEGVRRLRDRALDRVRRGEVSIISWVAA